MNKFRHFFVDQRGVAAIELALVLPIMLFLFFGAVEIGNLLSVDRRTTSVAATVSDLVGQSKTITDANMNDIFKAADAILAPFDPTKLTVVVSSVIENNGHRKVAWSSAVNTTARPKDSTVDDLVSDKLCPANTSVIVAEVTYKYQVAGGFYQFLNEGITLKDAFFVRPRRSLTVERIPPPT